MSPYTGFVGEQKYTTEKEKERIQELIKKLEKHPSNFVVIQFMTMEVNKVIFVEFNSSKRIEDLKKRIQDLSGLPPDQQRLVYNGICLENGSFLYEYNIASGSLIQKP